MSVIYWFRKDLRLADHPALNMALDSGEEVFLVATADQLGQSFAELSEIRKNSLRASWSHLSDSVHGRLTIVQNPNDLVSLATSYQVSTVYASTVYDPAGVAELAAVTKDLGARNIKLIAGSGNYAIAPGTVRKSDGSPYRVYTPFYNEWVKHEPGAPQPVSSLDNVSKISEASPDFNPEIEKGATTIAGEALALKTLERFIARRVGTYDLDRNRADIGGTSHLSHALSHGEIHPRTILNALGGGAGADVFRKEIAWREFYADVLFHRPDSLHGYLERRFEAMRYDQPGEKFEAWKRGLTGYPMVDAGMRQLLQTGWVHNRVRMIVASFLVKDLHIEWQHGASWFEENLTDFDPASNSHGWQWTAGCGTDASPYYRIFNPISQGLKFDPEGDYVRKYVPELRHLAAQSVHEPWNHPEGNLHGYPSPVIDHSVERAEALARLEEIKKP